jgi:hypothetical protein
VELGGKAKAQTVAFTLLSLPLYLAGQLERLIREAAEVTHKASHDLPDMKRNETMLEQTTSSS